MSRATGSGSLALLVFPGALVVYFAFNSGGMFELTTAFGALLVLTVILVCIASAREPLAGLSPLGAIACGALALFALWTLFSGSWSHASGRALIAFDRVLLYMAILALFACIPRTEARFRWLLRGLLVAGATVALIALVSRVLPGWWPTTTGLVNDRLTYWNTFGLLVGMTCILAVHHTCDECEPAAARIFAAALLPLLGATLLLTFSRGAILVTVLGIVVYLIAARPYGFAGGFLAAAPPSAIALVQTYSADLIHEGTPLIPAAIAEGKSLALTLFACAAGAALLRALTTLLDDRLTTLFSSSPEWRRGARIVGLAGCLAILVAFVVTGGPGALNRQYHSFFENTDEALSTEGQRARLLEIGNDGRLPMWQVARDAYREDPLKGTGAGTFQLQWERHRNDDEAPRLYTYSLYLESLGELGLLGILLLGGALLTIFSALAWRLRDPGRPIYAAGLALAIAWALHAGVDIDWQSPAVCVPVFAVGGLALARRREPPAGGSEQGSPTTRAAAVTYWLRPALALACLAVAVVPARMALAQSHLHDSVEALRADNCGSAVSNAHDSIDESDTGPRPYEVLAMCAARSDDPGAAVRWARRAVTRDPASWEPHFVLALARGVAGLDPRREARMAERANPLSWLPREAVAAYAGTAPQRWRRAAFSLPFAME
jgi:hypothetical protein